MEADPKNMQVWLVQVEREGGCCAPVPFWSMVLVEVRNEVEEVEVGEEELVLEGLVVEEFNVIWLFAKY